MPPERNVNRRAASTSTTRKSSSSRASSTVTRFWDESASTYRSSGSKSREESILTELSSQPSDRDAEGETDSEFAATEEAQRPTTRSSKTKNKFAALSSAPASFRPKSTSKIPGKAKTTAKIPKTPTITIAGVELQPTVAFDSFWRFCVERKVIDDKRRRGEPAPWTDDPILQKYFFCNTYRVLDKVSQYIVEEVIHRGPQDPLEVGFRVILFNIFTRIDTWELLLEELGVPWGPAGEKTLLWTKYSQEAYFEVLSAANEEGALYTAAFQKPAPDFRMGNAFKNHLCLLETMLENDIVGRLLGAPDLGSVFDYIISFPGMGDFSTYQLMLNLGYSNILGRFHRDDFVVAGLGAVSGLKKMLGKGYLEASSRIPGFPEMCLRWLVDNQDAQFARLGISFSRLDVSHVSPALAKQFPHGVPMDLSDVEHTVCEVDKYCRQKHPQIKQKSTAMKHTYTAPTEPNRSRCSRAYPTRPYLPRVWADPRRTVQRVAQKATGKPQKRYEIENIKDHRCVGQVSKKKGKSKGIEGPREFLVLWRGYSLKDATWEPEESLTDDAPQVVNEYLKKHGLK